MSRKKQFVKWCCRLCSGGVGEETVRAVLCINKHRHERTCSQPCKVVKRRNSLKDKKYGHSTLTGVAEPPLFWTAPAPDVRVPGADQIGSAPAPVKKRRLRLHTLNFSFCALKKLIINSSPFLDHNIFTFINYC